MQDYDGNLQVGAIYSGEDNDARSLERGRNLVGANLKDRYQSIVGHKFTR